MKGLLLILFPSLFFISCNEANKDLKLPEEGYFQINGSEMYFRTMGKGDPIIIVHGGPVLDHTYLLPGLYKLAETNTLIFYDQRACGKSSYEVDTTKMTLVHFAQDIKLLQDSLKLEKVTLLGHSWGGLIAMRYATMYPAFLDALILSNSLPADTKTWQEEQEVQENMVTAYKKQKRQEIMLSGLLESNFEEAVRQLMLLSFSSQFYDSLQLGNLKLNIAPDYLKRSAVFSKLAPDLMSYDLRTELQSLEVPILVMYGSMEWAASKGRPEWLNITPYNRYEVVPNAGHFPYLDNPTDYFTTISTFLASNRKRAKG